MAQVYESARRETQSLRVRHHGVTRRRCLVSKAAGANHSKRPQERNVSDAMGEDTLQVQVLQRKRPHCKGMSQEKAKRKGNVPKACERRTKNAPHQGNGGEYHPHGVGY